MSTDKPRRHYPAKHPVHNVVNRPSLIYVTVCTKNKKQILANSIAHQLIRDAWAKADAWVIGRYVIMPDHIHFFAAPVDPTEHPPLRTWVRYWKRLVTLSWPRPTEKPLWQKDCWDRQLRSGDSYSQKWEYVRNNPVRHGLVSSPDDWPYQGELTEFVWIDC